MSPASGLDRSLSARNPKWLLLALLVAPATLGLDFPVVKPPREMFQRHREQFLSRLSANSVAILHAAPERVFSNDVNYVYRQDSNFYYLTGFEEPGAVAVFRPHAPDGKRYILFVRPHDMRREVFEGPRTGPEEAASRFGADSSFPIGDFETNLFRVEAPGRAPVGYLSGVEALYLSDGGDGEWGAKLRSRIDGLRVSDFGSMASVDAREILHEMRLVKDNEEIALMRRAAEITVQGHILAMKAVAPGKYEFEVQQALDSYCFSNGARRMAYPSIVGSGPNSVFLHWEKNDRQMLAGELVLNDSGAEYGSYATDITRTYPVSGRFSPEQKALYEVVLAAQKGTLAIVKPGVTHEEIEKTSARLQTEGLVRLGLLSGEVDKLLAQNAYRKFTVHGISHWVGLDVHDAGRYQTGSLSRKLEPGMVLTVEPGIYIPSSMAGVEKKWWNIGVRIEDTLLVTPEGFECLSCAAPKEVADVERAVGKKQVGSQ